jgi:cell division septum initiation protein DivIVA
MITLIDVVQLCIQLIQRAEKAEEQIKELKAQIASNYHICENCQRVLSETMP